MHNFVVHSNDIVWIKVDVLGWNKSDGGRRYPHSPSPPSPTPLSLLLLGLLGVVNTVLIDGTQGEGDRFLSSSLLFTIVTCCCRSDR